MVGMSIECHSESYLGPSSTTMEWRPVQEESALSCLPKEMLEIIVCYLDGISAARLACTSAMFYNLVNEVARWDRFVLHEDLKERDLIDLGLNFGAPLWRLSFSCSAQKLSFTRTLDFPWRHIFHCHWMWSSIKKWNFSLPLNTSINMDEMTSLSIAGQNIIFGTMKGGLGVWNPDKSKASTKAIFCTHVPIDTILVQLSSDGGREDMHYRVIVHGIDTSLTVYDMSGYTIANGISKFRDLRKISSHGDSVFEWDPDRGTTAITVVGKKVVERCGELQNSTLPYGPFLALDIHEQLVISQQKGPLLMKYNGQKSKYTTEQLCRELINACIIKAYIWPGQISFNISSFRTTIVSIGRNCAVIKWPHGFKCVSACLFSKILIIGTDVGRVLLYPLKDPSDLLKLNPQSYEKELYIGIREPIFYVGVRVQNHIHHLPDIVAATRSKLFCFRATGFCKLN